MHHTWLIFLCLTLAAILQSCAMVAPLGSVPTPRTTPRWSLALHGGAGTIDRALLSEAQVRAYEDSLAAALALGREGLTRGDSAIDVCERVVRMLEDNPLFNAGHGAVFTFDGTHELDASIMDGSTGRAGAVAGVRVCKNPITLARRVMERTPHVLLAGDGADAFAEAQAEADRRESARAVPTSPTTTPSSTPTPIIEIVPNTYFDTPSRRESWEKLRSSAASDAAVRDVGAYGTVGCVALDQHGHVAAATSTGGMTNKRWGRVGDSPIIGAGTYASDRTCAVSCTGTGEQFIRHTVAREIAALMEYRRYDAQTAACEVIHGRLQPGDGGVIVVSHTGEIALVFNSTGMYRGAADSQGRFEVAIWESCESSE